MFRITGTLPDSYLRGDPPARDGQSFGQIIGNFVDIIRITTAESH